MFEIGAILFSAVVIGGAVFVWFKHETDFHKQSEAAVLPGNTDPETGERPITKAVVTYTDGSSEVFEVSEEITLSDGGVIIIRLSDGRCVTVSANAYRKIEEL